MVKLRSLTEDTNKAHQYDPKTAKGSKFDFSKIKEIPAQSEKTIEQASKKDKQNIVYAGKQERPEIATEKTKYYTPSVFSQENEPTERKVDQHKYLEAAKTLLQENKIPLIEQIIKISEFKIDYNLLSTTIKTIIEKTKTPINNWEYENYKATINNINETKILDPFHLETTTINDEDIINNKINYNDKIDNIKNLIIKYINDNWLAINKKYLPQITKIGKDLQTQKEEAIDIIASFIYKHLESPNFTSDFDKIAEEILEHYGLNTYNTKKFIKAAITENRKGLKSEPHQWLYGAYKAIEHTDEKNSGKKLKEYFTNTLGYIPLYTNGGTIYNESKSKLLNYISTIRSGENLKSILLNQGTEYIKELASSLGIKVSVPHYTDQQILDKIHKDPGFRKEVDQVYTQIYSGATKKETVSGEIIKMLNPYILYTSLKTLHHITKNKQIGTGTVNEYIDSLILADCLNDKVTVYEKTIRSLSKEYRLEWQKIYKLHLNLFNKIKSESENKEEAIELINSNVIKLAQKYFIDIINNVFNQK